MQQKLTGRNTVFFSTANDKYVSNAAISLISIRDFVPDAKLYILSRNISPKNKRFLKRKNINFIELDLTYLFFQTWEYPIECYYIFAGPKIFYDLGFQYSVYIDDDILCLKNPLVNCEDIIDIGGVKVNTFRELFGEEKDILLNTMKIDETIFEQKRINSGVVYMNNQQLVKLKFLETSGELYLKCWTQGIPRKGDDSLFALFQLCKNEELSPKILPDNYNYINQYHKNNHIDQSVIFFHFDADKPWKTHPYKHQEQNMDKYNFYIKKWRQMYLKASPNRWLNSLIFFRILKKIKRKIFHIFLRIPFIVTGIRYPYIKKRINLKKPPLKLYWWFDQIVTDNFGDTVSKDILLNLFGRSVSWAAPNDCDLIAAGSILEIIQNANPKRLLYAWGSGFIRENSSNVNLNNIIFKAVRGNKTKKRINKKIPTGDPGILVNATYSLRKKCFSKKIGVVIHYADFQLDIVKRFCNDSRFEVITPLDNPENVAKKISSCSLILSSSLHGLIFADSLSVPNAHIKLSDNLTGGSYKFLDYYSGVGKKYLPADINKIFDDKYLSKLKREYQPIPNKLKKQRALVKAFPFN